ncbi:alkaline phosphatase family protein [Kitasatospora sp. NPDC056076]|uniref:alkaline phosphatase family protein n=1 Tax=Kitasatospora sp. NPDC056076 TaxID=3345703 RepID=UPI0035D57004
MDPIERIRQAITHEREEWHAWLAGLRAGRAPAPQGRIRHVFVLVLENRSFDHMLGVSTGTVADGSLRHGIGTDAVTGAPTTVDGPDTRAGNHHAGTDHPVRLGAPFALPVDPPHEFCDVMLQLASTAITGRPHDDRCAYDGTYPPITLGGFVDNYVNEATVKQDAEALADPGAVMACFTADQLPVLSTLAREFAVCDRWFSALPGPTWPNRFFLHAASSAGLDHSPDPVDTVRSKLSGYTFEHGTLYEALDDKGLPWRVYAGDALPQVSALAGMDLPTTVERYHHLDDLAEHLQDPGYPAAYTFIEPNYGHVLTHGGDFRCGNSQHPLDDVTDGEALIKSVYEGLRRSPLWESSLLVITYDEHGGFYDHVPPPAAVPPGDRTDPEHSAHGFRFDRLGVRVPTVVVSPWIPAAAPAAAPAGKDSGADSGADGRNCNLIDHTQYDHGSLLATVERLFGLAPLTDRDARANDFLHLLSADAPREAPRTLPDPAESGVSWKAEAAGPADPGRPVTATLRGFVETAAIQEARLHPQEHDRISRRAAGIATVADAEQYLSDITAQLGRAGLRIARPPQG